MPDLVVTNAIDTFMGSADQAAMRTNLGGITGPDLATNPRTRTITLGVRVNAGVVPTGPILANAPLSVTGTITGWKMVCTPAATVTVDLWKKNADPPADANSIVDGGGTLPAIVAGKYATDGVAGWNHLAVAAGDIIEANVDANDLAQQIAITLTMLED